MLDDFARFVHAENIHHGFAPILRRSAAEHVQPHQIAVGRRAFDFGAGLRVFFQKRRERVDKRFAAVGHGGVVLDVGLGHVFAHGFVEFVLVERQIVKRQNIGFVALRLALAVRGGFGFGRGVGGAGGERGGCEDEGEGFFYVGFLLMYGMFKTV